MKSIIAIISALLMAFAAQSRGYAQGEISDSRTMPSHSFAMIINHLVFTARPIGLPVRANRTIVQMNWATSLFDTFAPYAVSNVADIIFHFGETDPNNLAGTATVTFDDEFNSLSLWNGQYGSSSSGTWLTYWHPEGGQFRSNYLNWYINSNYEPTSTVLPWTVSNGILSLTAAPAAPAIQPSISNYQYTSGLIDTALSFSQTYGYFEMRAKLPAGQGLQSAFWLMGYNTGPYEEIDVEETIGSQPTQLLTSVWSGPKQAGVNHKTTVPDTSTGFHTYGVDWESNTITWYFDGQEVFQTATPPDMNQPMFIIANVAVGGIGSWPGPPNASTQFPASMQIDYIRAYSSYPGSPANR